MTSDNNDLICTKAAAKLLGLSPQTLEKWRSQGRGPVFVRIGSKAIRYRCEALTQFIESGHHGDV